jgi:hypothetical protein
MKAAVRRILGPIVRPILRRIGHYASPDVTALRDEVQWLRGEVEQLRAAWHQHLPAVVNASISVAAISREQLRTRREHEQAIEELRRAIAGMVERQARAPEK